MTDNSQTVQQRVTAFLERKAQPNQSMGDWLFQDFPRGLEEIVRRCDEEAAACKEECSTLFSGCNLKGMSFSDPRFPEEYAAVRVKIMAAAENQEGECFHGNRVGFLLTDLNQAKQAYEEVCQQRELLIDRLLPRLKELATGAALTTDDYELLYQAQEASKVISAQYDRVVTRELKPAAGTYAGYQSLLRDLLKRAPKPPEWDMHVEQQRRNSETSQLFGNH